MANKAGGTLSSGGLPGGHLGSARSFIVTVAMVAASTIVGLFVAPRWGISPVDLLYLPAVLAAAALYGVGPGLIASLLSVVAFDYVFTRPVGSLRISSPEDVATAILLFLVAVVTSQLAARMRAGARAASANAARNATIAGLARRLLGCTSDAAIGEVACADLARLYDCNAALVRAGAEPRVLAIHPATVSLAPSDLSVAGWTMERDQPAGRGAMPVGTTEWIFYPVRSTDEALGAFGLARDDGRPPVPDDHFDLLDNLLDQVALALERSRLEAAARSAAELHERNRLRSALLATIGQDIEPRLSAITRSSDTLRREAAGDKAALGELGSEVVKLRRYLSDLLELGPESDMRPVVVGDVVIDLFHRRVLRDGREVHLAPKEYAVLAELAKYAGRVLTHAHLLRTAWGPAHEHQTDYLRVAVRALRQKLEAEPSAPRLIINEPAVGYRLVK